MPEETTSEEFTVNNQAIGSWRCDHCGLTCSSIWRGQPHPDEAPTCCGGELMVPYRIPNREVLDIKTVSRWIDDIECAALATNGETK